MIDLIEKSLLTGLGALALTQKKAEELAEELKERLNLSEEKGRELLESLQKAAEENQQKLESLAREEIEKACDRLGLVKEDELNKLRKRVEKLEKQLKSDDKS